MYQLLCVYNDVLIQDTRAFKRYCVIANTTLASSVD